MLSVVIFIIDVAVIPVWGWALSATWSWFVLPIFGGLPAFDWRQGVGLSVFWSVLAARIPWRSQTDEESVYRCAMNVLSAFFMLGVGRLVAGWLGTA